MNVSGVRFAQVPLGAQGSRDLEFVPRKVLCQREVEFAPRTGRGRRVVKFLSHPSALLSWATRDPIQRCWSLSL